LLNLGRVEEILNNEAHHFCRRFLDLDRNFERVEKVYEVFIKFDFVPKYLPELLAGNHGFDLNNYSFLSLYLSRDSIQRISDLVIYMSVNSLEDSVVLLGLAVLDGVCDIDELDQQTLGLV
jgi:hypothetical protein